MYGGGRNGKGCMIRLLNKLLGPTVMPKVPPNQNTIRFWMHSLLGKRLITMSDCDVQDFVTQGAFKMLTGGDLVPIEVKGGSEFSADLDCKFLIASNDKPEVSRQLSDIRRAIYVTFGPIPCEPHGTYESRLWLEAPGIVARCLECYQEQVGPNHGSIPINSDALDDLIDENESEMQEFFDRYFDLDDDDTKLEKDRYMFSGDELIRLMRDVYGNNFKKKRSEFIKFLQNKYCIFRKTVSTVSGKRYVGAKRNGIYSMKRMMMIRQDEQLQANTWTEFKDQKDE
jgi:phage/plasmid-associated DNA primase